MEPPRSKAEPLPCVQAPCPDTPHARPSLRSACFLQQQADRLALTGEGCSCIVLTLGGGSSDDARRFELGSAGVAVRTHAREPQQLMVAQEEGHVHFLDLRLPGSRPSLARSLPPGESALYDADWSAHDTYLVGGVCGGRWVAWDLRKAGIAAPQHAGDAQQGGCTSFRFSPAGRSFATAGTGGEVLVYHIQPAEAAAASMWAPTPTRLAHDLPTRVSGLSWMHVTTPAPMLVGAADRRVCVWSLPSATMNGVEAAQQFPRPMALL